MKTRSQLYVPANNEKMVINSLRLNADIIIYDLEDAVPDDKKDSARSYILEFLKTNIIKKAVAIRINSMETPYFYNDITSLLKTDAKIDYIMIPKACTGIKHIYRLLGIPLIPLIETAEGFTKINDIAHEDGVSMISWAAADFSLSVSGNIDGYAQNTYIATAVAVAARSAGILPIDKVYFDLNNINGFRDEAVRSKNLGFAGKQVIHPTQIDIANSVYAPSEEEINWAKMVIEEYNKSASQGRGALRIDGRLIDSVHIRMARNILDQADMDY